MNIKTIVTALAPLFLVASAQAAYAADLRATDDMSAPVTRVSTSDLDLRNPADRLTLDRRIRRATEAVCPEVSMLDLHALRLQSECRRAALHGTEQRVAALIDKAGKRDTALARSDLR